MRREMRRIAIGAAVVLIAACGTPASPSPAPASAPTVPAAAPTDPNEPLSDLRSPRDVIVPPSSGSIAYVIGRDGARELHITLPDGTGDLSCGVGSVPSWSWDGQALVFAGPERPTADGYAFPDLYRAAADCTGVTMVIEEGTAPHLSPDGARLTFGRGVIDTGDAWIAQSDGSAQQQLMPATSPAWSPDGAWLSMTPDTGTGTVEFGLVRPDGTGYHVLTRGGAQSWTPDGRIVYVRADDPKASTTLRVITVDGAVTDLFTAPGEIESPQMLESGRVVFVLDGDVWRLDPGSRDPVRLSQGLQAASPLSLSPDGAWAAIAAGGTLPGLAVVSVDGGWIRTIPGDVSGVAWRPDVR